MNANLSIWAGFVASDVELKYLPDGRPLASFSLAYNRPAPKGSAAGVKGATDFIDVKIWGKTGEGFMAKVKKGAAVIVYGPTRQDRWKDQSGQERTRHTLEAYIVGLQITPNDAPAS